MTASIDGVKAVSANMTRPPGKKDADRRPMVVAAKPHIFRSSDILLNIKYE